MEGQRNAKSKKNKLLPKLVRRRRGVLELQIFSFAPKITKVFVRLLNRAQKLSVANSFNVTMSLQWENGGNPFVSSVSAICMEGYMSSRASKYIQNI